MEKKIISHPAKIYTAKRVSLNIYFLLRGFTAKILNHLTGETALLEVQNTQFTYTGILHRNLYSDMNVFEIISVEVRKSCPNCQSFNVVELGWILDLPNDIPLSELLKNKKPDLEKLYDQFLLCRCSDCSEEFRSKKRDKKS